MFESILNKSTKTFIMKTKIITFALCSFLLSQTFAQSTETDKISQSEISKLNFITGHWEVQGWMMGADGKKSEFEQTEKIQFKLDSTAILIEGLGKYKGKIIHNAMAIVSFNKENNDYTF